MGSACVGLGGTHSCERLRPGILNIPEQERCTYNTGEQKGRQTVRFSTARTATGTQTPHSFLPESNSVLLAVFSASSQSTEHSVTTVCNWKICYRCPWFTMVWSCDACRWQHKRSVSLSFIPMLHHLSLLYPSLDILNIPHTAIPHQVYPATATQRTSYWPAPTVQTWSVCDKLCWRITDRV